MKETLVQRELVTHTIKIALLNPSVSFPTLRKR